MDETMKTNPWEKELRQFLEMLAEPKGQAIVIVGPAGSGKSTLLRDMIILSEKEKSFHVDPRIIHVSPDNNPNTVLSYISDQKITYLQTASILQSLSESVKEFGDLHRKVIGIDANPTLPVTLVNWWIEIIAQLPEKVKFIFTQRPNDILATNDKFMNLPNVVRMDVEPSRSSDDGYNNEKSIVKDLEDFLINGKEFPNNFNILLSQDSYVDLSINYPNSDEMLAYFNIRTGKFSKKINDFLKTSISDHKNEIVERPNPFNYYVLPSEESNENFKIVESINDESSEVISNRDFPTFNQLLFAYPLSDKDRRIYRELIRIAKYKHDLTIYTPCENYIDLQIKGSRRTAAQIHRYGDPNSRIGLVLPGYIENFPNYESNNIALGVISLLSGFNSNSQNEINWLKGNLGHEQLKYEAGVYVLGSEILKGYELRNEVTEILELAKKNAEGNIESEEKKVLKYGQGAVATIQMDKLSEVDLLGRDKMIMSFAGMFMHTKDVEGFTVALLGDWGEGKSTMMKLLRNRLNEKHSDRFDFATFNAWEYERTDNIAAGLAQEVVNGLLKPLQKHFWKRQKLRFKFAIKEYKGELCRLGIYSLVAILFILVSSIFFENNVLRGLGLAGGIAALIFLFYKSLPKIIEHPIAIKLETYLKLPNYGKHLGDIPIIQSHLKTLCSLRLVENKKLIVFVDDLDRCHTNCIARVLDAIRLVMSIPNVIVMIGIDYRIAFKAMENYYEKLGDEERDKSEIARDYLGKIIQLPVRIMHSSPEDVRKYIEKGLFPDAQVVEDFKKKDDVVESPKPRKEINDVENKGTRDLTLDEKNKEEPKSVEEILKDTTIERDMFSDLAKRFNFTNPRQLLRLRNSYRFLKVMDSNEKYDREMLMKILFWYEFLYNLSYKARSQCKNSVIKLELVEEIENLELKQIVKNVKDEIHKITELPIYNEIENFIHIVVLPHH